MTRFSAHPWSLLFALGASLVSNAAALPAGAQTASAPMPQILQDYIYGYAPVALTATRALMTAVPDATSSPGRAPINQFARVETLATPAERLIPRPNADTLYSLAWLDLRKEPMVLHVPDTVDRYYLMPLYDAYSNEFASIGSRTTGDGQGDFAIVGPFWRGDLPSGLQAVRAPTDTVWIIGRTLVRGPSDLAAAQAITSQYQLVPLSAYAEFLATGVYNPPSNVPVTLPNPDFIGEPITSSPLFSKPEFFDVLAETALRNPPPLPQLRSASRLVEDGLLHQNELTSAVVSDADQALLDEITTQQTRQNGWSVDLKTGSYGTDYLARAATARFGLGANIAADAVYPSAETDVDGDPLVGSKDYVIHFAPGQLPPVKGFWSLTVYDQNGFLVANPIKRYTVGSETGLAANADGSVDILLQNTAPATLTTNWLPTPLAPFTLTLRLYWPEEAVLNGTYEIPPVEAAEPTP